jgi:hypothetical protein
MARHRVVPSKLVIVPLVALAMAAFSAQPSGQRGKPGSQRQEVREARATERRITAQQLDDAQTRIAIATALVNRLEPQAQALGRSPEWRRVSLNLLLSQSLESLRLLEQEPLTPDSIADAITRVEEDPNLLGENDEDLVYMPMVPCRYIDTRAIGGPIFGDRTYDVDANGSAYGGDATCDPTSLPHVGNGDDLGALAMNVTITNPTSAPGFVAIKPQTTSPITSLMNWYEAGAHVQLANQGIITMHQGAGPEFVISTSATVDVIVDIFGAFVNPEATPLETMSVTVPWSVAGSATFSVAAACPIGFSIAGGGWNQDVGAANSVDVRQSSRDGANHGWRCGGQGTPAGSGICEAICVRVPGRQ